MKEEIYMELVRETPRHGIPSSPKPICIGYEWASWFYNMTDQFTLHFRLILEDYGKFIPRYVRFEVSFIPRDKAWQEKLSQISHVPFLEPESSELGISHIYDLGLFRQEKRFGLIGYENAEYKFSSQSSNDSEIRVLWAQFNVSGLLVEEFILNQLQFVVGEDPRLKKNLNLALKRLAKMNHQRN